MSKTLREINWPRDWASVFLSFLGNDNVHPRLRTTTDLCQSCRRKIPQYTSFCIFRILLMCLNATLFLFLWTMSVFFTYFFFLLTHGFFFFNDLKELFTCWENQTLICNELQIFFLVKLRLLTLLWAALVMQKFTKTNTSNSSFMASGLT